jgi:hypothetical protein
LAGRGRAFLKSSQTQMDGLVSNPSQYLATMYDSEYS